MDMLLKKRRHKLNASKQHLNVLDPYLKGFCDKLFGKFILRKRADFVY